MQSDLGTSQKQIKINGLPQARSMFFLILNQINK